MRRAASRHVARIPRANEVKQRYKRGEADEDHGKDPVVVFVASIMIPIGKFLAIGYLAVSATRRT